MKIKKIENFKNKELKLRLIKTKTYEPLIKIEDILIRLKKAIKIIYRYDMSNKKILFIGSSLELVKKISNLLKNTKHSTIPESSWTGGILLNRPKKLKLTNLPVKSKKKVELLVILNQIENKNILEESYSAKIPIIYFGADLEILDKKTSIKIPGSFKLHKKKIYESFFYSILSASIKRAKMAKLFNKKTTEFLRTNQKQKNKNGYKKNKK